MAAAGSLSRRVKGGRGGMWLMGVCERGGGMGMGRGSSSLGIEAFVSQCDVAN